MFAIGDKNHEYGIDETEIILINQRHVERARMTS